MQEILENGKFILTNEDGIEEEYKTLITFKDNESKMNYVVYTDDSLDENGNLNIFASKFKDESSELMAVETDEEWNIIEEILSEELNKKDEY